MANTEVERARMDVKLKDRRRNSSRNSPRPPDSRAGQGGNSRPLSKRAPEPQASVRFQSRTLYANRTSLHLAAMMQGHEELVEFILTHPRISREVVNAKDHFGCTPLHLAVREQREGVVSLLLLSSLVLPDRYMTVTSERDERSQNHGGYTPLHLAAVTGNVAIARLLLRQPCQSEFPDCDPVNIQAMTWNGDTALDIARQQSYPELVELLENSDLHWLEKERERNAMSANAILVGAALVAAIAFGCWLQPPGGIPTSTASSRELASFYIFVALAFACSVTALVIGTLATVSYTGNSVRVEVQQLRRAV